ncbi:MAG: hypothetical protein R3Y06_01530 [Faecalibacterium sp.]
MRFRNKQGGNTAAASGYDANYPLPQTDTPAKRKPCVSPQPDPRALHNPYGRLFTKDRSFAELLPDKGDNPHK